MNTINLKCPMCGSFVEFNPDTGMMRCEHCEMDIPTAAFGQLEGRMDEPVIKEDRSVSQSDEVAESGGGMKTYKPPSEAMGGMKTYIPPSANKVSTDVYQPLFLDETPEERAEMEMEMMETNLYHCTSCGAKLMVNGTEASTFCSFCGSPTIVFDRVSKEIKPQKIIPFKISAEKALESIKEKFTDRTYIPKKIQELDVDEVRAIYIPYWLYDVRVHRNLEIITKYDDDSRRYLRDASVSYEKVTMDGSSKLHDDLSRRLEPFDMKDLTDFDVAYLSGFYADKANVTGEQLRPALHERVRKFLDDEILSTCPSAYDGMVGEFRQNNIDKHVLEDEFAVDKMQYALLPAYFVNLRYDNGVYLVIVNGQTGKVVGNLPTDARQIRRRFAKNVVISCIIFTILLTLCMIVPKMRVLIAIAFAWVLYAIVGGSLAYNKYKKQQAILAGRAMSSYVNEREGR